MLAGGCGMRQGGPVAGIGLGARRPRLDFQVCLLPAVYPWASHPAALSLISDILICENKRQGGRSPRILVGSQITLPPPPLRVIAEEQGVGQLVRSVSGSRRAGQGPCVISPAWALHSQPTSWPFPS